MGLDVESPLLLAVGFAVFGPKRMQTMLGHVARAKAELHKESRGIKSQLAGEIKATAARKK
jgi:Sec-independent protein translocase protein TatA